MQFSKTIKLKVCGMREDQNIAQVAALHPDYMGFIFYEKSPRFVGKEWKMLPINEPVKKVGVFVDTPLEQLHAAAEKYGLDYVQLHGDESVKICESLRERNIKVIKVFSMGDDFDFTSTQKFEAVSDYFLFDTKGLHRGGNGQAFDWKILNRYNQHVPFFLSGGISATNIRDMESLLKMNLHAIDINSGVEKKPGIKDIEIVKEIKDFLTNLNSHAHGK